MASDQPTSALPLYAVIDLGSNSFHMLITRLVANSVQTVDKVKRKVRLASGLDKNNQLNETAIARGLECLSFFAERLQDIPEENIRIVATATLRIATNAQEFLTRAEKILNKNITVLTGEQEAKQIYLGVAHTSCCESQRLVVDIGGASTELIIGEGFQSQKITSINIGCVSFMQNYFSDGQLNDKNFTQAIAAAKQQLLSLVPAYKKFGWQSVLGGSGTMQALAEILDTRHQPASITLNFMQEIQHKLIAGKKIDHIEIKGLARERTPVFASGLAILIAIFECFHLQKLQLSRGALREGLLYEMLPEMRKMNIRQRTVNSISKRFHIDQPHANRVIRQAEFLFKHFRKTWQLSDADLELLVASCALHEVGLLLEYKCHPQHGAYIIKHADLPGFEQADQQLLIALIGNCKLDISTETLHNQSATNYYKASRLLTILRLAIILCHRRRDDVLPFYQTSVDNQSKTKDKIHLSLPPQWLATHPLIADELQQENRYLQTIGLTLLLE